jgi:hypothetical protein
LLGLDLDAYFDYASDCLNAIIYTIDDFDYFANNITLEVSWVDPMLNFTQLLGGNFSSSLVYCFEFGFSMYTTEVTTFSEFGNFGNWILAFLFN